jgi:hypothetical protein
MHDNKKVSRFDSLSFLFDTAVKQCLTTIAAYSSSPLPDTGQSTSISEDAYVIFINFTPFDYAESLCSECYITGGRRLMTTNPPRYSISDLLDIVSALWKTLIIQVRLR